MSSNNEPKLVSSGAETVSRVEGECGSTNNDYGAKKATEHASEEVDSTTETVYDLSKPGNTANFNNEQLGNGDSLAPIYPQDDSAKEEDVLKSKPVYLPSTIKDSDNVVLSSDEGLSEGKTSFLVSREQAVAPEQQLESKRIDTFSKKMNKEALMRLGLYQDPANDNKKETSKDAQDTEDANKASNNSFEATCEPSSTSDDVHPTQKRTANPFQDTWKAPSTFHPSNPFINQTEMSIGDPSSSTDVAQPPQNHHASRFKSVGTDTDEQVSFTSDEFEMEEEEFDYWLDPQRLRSVPALKETTNQSEPRPPTTFFGKLHQNSPLAYTGCEKESIPIKGKGSLRSWEDFLQIRMQNVEKPLNLSEAKATSSHKASEEVIEEEKINLSEVKVTSSHKASEEVHEKESPLEEKRYKEKDFKEALEKRMMQEVKAWEKPQENNDSPSSNEDLPGMKEVTEVNETMELKDTPASLELPHIEACALISAKEKESNSLNQDSFPSHSKVTSPSKSTETPTAHSEYSSLAFSKDWLSTHSQDSVAQSKASLPSRSQDFLPLNTKDSLSSPNEDSPPSPNVDSPPSPSQNSLPLHTKDSSAHSIHTADSSPSSNEDSPPSLSKDSLPLPNKDDPPSLSKDSPSHIKTTLPSHSKDSVPLPNKESSSLNKESPSLSKASPLHIKDSIPPQSKDSDIKNLASSYCNDSTSHGQHSTPSHGKETPSHNQDYLQAYSKYSSPVDEAQRCLRPFNGPKLNSAAGKPKATQLEEQKKEQFDITEPYDPEFPSIISVLPTTELNADNLDMIRGMPNARASHMYKWLYSQSLTDNEYELKVVEALPEYSLIVYSDCDEDMDIELEEQHEEQEEGSGSKSTENMDALIDCFQSLQLNEAIPECCLTDSVFLVDKPQSSVSLKFKLPSMPLEDICSVNEYFKIRVTHVYTPFQFWFNFVDRIYDTSDLLEMQLEMGKFYSDHKSGYVNALPRCLLKADYLCAIQSEEGWRRARIVAAPPPAVDIVSIYYLDYGYGGDVSAAELRYLPHTFAEKPELAIRGTLSYIHPLGPHWSPDSMQQFQRLIIGKELFAHIVELDLKERIVFLRISLNQGFVPSVNKMLVDANLAGRSQHYDSERIKNNFGIRHRYLRERLPSHEMLEMRVFPILDEQFEVAFDGIIYSPAFGKFKVPRLTKSYESLRQALVAWMPAYRLEMEHWAALYTEAKAKQSLAQSEAREAWLLRKEGETEKERNESISEHIEKMEILEVCEPEERVTKEGKEQEEGTL